MTKSLTKVIMTSSRLKNKFNKNSSAENWEKYFNNLNIKKYLIIKPFGHQVNYFSQMRGQIQITFGR